MRSLFYDLFKGQRPAGPSNALFQRVNTGLQSRMTVCFIHDCNLWGVFALVSEREILGPTDFYSYILQQSWNNERQISAVMIKHDISPRLQSLWECLTWSISAFKFIFFIVYPPPPPPISPLPASTSVTSPHLRGFKQRRRLQQVTALYCGNQREYSPCPEDRLELVHGAQCLLGKWRCITSDSLAAPAKQMRLCLNGYDGFFFFLFFFLGSRGEQPFMILSQLYLSATSDRHGVVLIDRSVWTCVPNTPTSLQNMTNQSSHNANPRNVWSL